ncbi:MAG: cytochrome c family protein [Gammaproteobacteria bacterium]|nr:cytochrome c family protein [Gammaproteobacteria bacterium]
MKTSLIFKQTLRTLLCTIAIFTTPAWASVPPPPVNQNIGIPDGVLNDMTFQTCLGCHGDPVNAPAPVNIGYLPDRHHLRVDTPIEEYSASPFPEASPSGDHKCITCHKVDWVEDSSRPLGGYFKFALDPTEPIFRDCLTCHEQKPGIASVHHLTPKAQDALCPLCHGSLIDFPYGDHYIPDYDISFITPWPGDNYDSSSPSNQFDPPVASYNDRRKGNCEHCHFSGTDQVTGLVIPTNRETHHGTGVGQPDSGSVHGCDLCHDTTPPNHTIRGCEKCHGVSSLHNIEFDRNGDGITPGKEEPFWGHIGSPANCRGCHGNFAGASTEAILQSDQGLSSGANIVPTITHMGMGKRSHRSRNLSSASLSTRQLQQAPQQSTDSRTLSFTGSGFTSKIASPDGTIEIIAKLVLTNKTGETFEYEPSKSTPTTLEYILPENLESGSYDVHLAKKSIISPIANLVIRPDLIVSDISCDSGEVVINGSGFISYLNAESSGTNITNSKTSEECSIESWEDHKIIANCGTGSVENIKINSIFGDTLANAACEGSSTGRPDWWSLWSWFASWGWAGR